MTDRLKVLHVGCGSGRTLHELFAGWQEVRLDIDPQVRPDVVASMTDMSPVPAGTIDAIYSRHNLEHLDYHEIGLALREFRRVLKPGGFAIIRVPDLQIVAELILKGRLEETHYVSPAGPIAAIDMLFGFRPSLAAGNRFMAHRVGFTMHTLAQHILGAGMFPAVVRALSTHELWAEAGTVREQPHHLAQIRELQPLVQRPQGAVNLRPSP